MIKYRVKNISHADWQSHGYMVIRDCNKEAAPNNGYWYWGCYDDLVIAYNAANRLDNGLVVETENVEAVY